MHKKTELTLEPACFYLRKSREDQEAEARGEGETLAKHRTALFKLAKEYGVNITKVFEEIVSGESLIHRPEMLELLKEVESGQWKSVFCMDIDRLGRGKMQDQGMILETFKGSRTLIVTPRKLYDLNDEFDEEYTEFEAFMARKELKLITRRMQGGRIRSVEAGNYIGTRPPYGYLIEKNGDSRYLVPHSDQAPIVKMIFQLYTADDPNLRMGSVKIAAELNRMGVTTYTGKPWEASTVLFILKNAVYTGRLQWKKVESKKSKDPDKRRDSKTRPREEWIDVPGKHDPLVSKELFEKAQAILKGKYHVPFQLINGITNPLAGLIKCELCGASMIYRPYKHQQYPHLLCINPQCKNKSSRFEYVEQRLLDGLTAWLENYRVQWEENKPEKRPTNNLISIKKKVLQNLEKELAELEQQKNNLHEFLEKKVYDIDTYLSRSKILSDRIQERTTALQEAQQAVAIETKRVTAQKKIIPRLKKVLEVYPNTEDPAAKNALLKSVLDHATYRKEQNQKNDEFALSLYPKPVRG